jgi:hypothetical protein
MNMKGNPTRILNEGSIITFGALASSNPFDIDILVFQIDIIPRLYIG